MIPTAEWLARLGSGVPIARLCAEAGASRAEFDAWWLVECRRRVPATTGTRNLPGLRGPVRIARDPRGVPHISAGTDRDLFFGFGFAVAQDRLFQLEYLRRHAAGRLAEVMGPAAVELDRLFRTLDLTARAEREWAELPDETRELLAAYAAGVDAVITESRDNLPIEFDLLGYRPEPWRPVDSLLALNGFRWYLTVRFPVIVAPELVKRAVGDGPLFREFTTGEADDESILQPGEYPAGRRRNADAGGGEDSPGSNNWVLAARRTTTGKPIVASDPHVPFNAVSIWYQVVLCGGSFRVAGASLAGVPPVMVGRTPRVAWGITNNICSLRDLYQEKTDPAHPNCFLFDGLWEPARERKETIRVRGSTDVTLTVRSSRNGPIVDDVLPPAARHTGPVSLRWQGFESCGWLTAMFAMNRAKTASELRAAAEPWSVPTFNLVFADDDGHTGFQTVGKIPVRDIPERGYRPGWDPAHAWRGTIPYSALPALADPPRGYVVTANNRLAPADFPWPLSGAWSSGHRARRARELIEASRTHSPDDNRPMQLDIRSGQAAAVVPALLDVVGNDPEFASVVQLLRAWDFRTTADSCAASVSYTFTHFWIRAAVLPERIPAEQIELLAPFAAGMAIRLLRGDPHGWFRSANREDAIRVTLRAVVANLTVRFGPDPAGWAWGKLHTLTQKHVLSGGGDLGSLLDRSGYAMPGDNSTLFNATSDPATHTAVSGAGFRMIADLAEPGGLWAIEVGGVSGHPGSPHYDDQIRPWLAGEYNFLPLAEAPETTSAALTLQPRGD